MLRINISTIHVQTIGMNLVIIYKIIIISLELMGEIKAFEVLKFLHYDSGVEYTSYIFFFFVCELTSFGLFSYTLLILHVVISN